MIVAVSEAHNLSVMSAKDRFWAGIAKEVFEAPYCTKCQTFFFYPRDFCPTCWSEVVEWRRVSGTGAVVSHSTVHFPVGSNPDWKAKLPYIVALVRLDEGIVVMSNILGSPPDQLRVGLPVRLTYHTVGKRKLHAFVAEEGQPVR